MPPESTRSSQFHRALVFYDRIFIHRRTCATRTCSLLALEVISVRHSATPPESGWSTFRRLGLPSSDGRRRRLDGEHGIKTSCEGMYGPQAIALSSCSSRSPQHPVTRTNSTPTPAKHLALYARRSQMGSIIVVNASSQTVSCFVSKYSNSGGDDSWFTLSPGQRDSWGRNGWELVAFKNAGDTNRGGVYTRVDSTVTFHDFNNISH
ncbi:hypothetical protein C8Q80DRAFT_283812 [Daedaleopsis nitida]|nr:hypothetical protein C8Q80DRAFT_283812 [Daedaleopsis nitida]